MAIKVWDYLDEYEQEREEILAAVDTVFRSGRLILGEQGKSFEREFAAYCGAAHGVGLDNATNALFLALRALDVGEGDEVITVSNTAVPTVSAIVSAGAVPRFVDIDPATYLMRADQLESAITDRTRAILPVHLYGQCADMTAIARIAAARGLRVVEDCSQAHGAAHHGQRAGSMSEIGVFSFYPTKPLGGYGDGGMAVTSDAALDAKLRRLRFYGMENLYYAEEHGYNSRLDEVHAAILRAKLARLDGYIERRRALARRYEDLLAGTPLTLPVTAEGNFHVFYVYVARHPDRDRILAELKKRDVLLNISYPWPIHTMRGYERFGGREGDLPETERAAREIFSLPMYPSLSFADQDRAAEALRDVLGTP